MKRDKVLWRRVMILGMGGTAVCLLLFILGIALTGNIRRCFLSLFLRDDPKFAAQVAHKLIDYDLPPDYHEASAMQVMTYYRLAIIASNNHPSDLIAIQTGTDLQRDAVYGADSQERVVQEIGELRYQTHTVGIQDISVGGKPSELRILEGTDENGTEIRQALTVFTGKNSNVMVIVVGDIETWDSSVVDQFLASIR